MRLFRKLLGKIKRLRIAYWVLACRDCYGSGCSSCHGSGREYLYLWRGKEEKA